ncbi:MAG: hypothetical protein PWQ61_2978, partial [Betaproteobacteria bacterium]|nr:hypothetical protein [Betaproteobacteria bacterium]
MKSVPVWAWLPGETEPRLAGELRTDEGKTGHFVYDESFMDREGAVLELPERHRANAHSCAGNQYGAPDQACGNHLGV